MQVFEIGLRNVCVAVVNNLITVTASEAVLSETFKGFSALEQFLSVKYIGMIKPFSPVIVTTFSKFGLEKGLSAVCAI